MISSYTGDNREFAFSGPIFDGYYEDIRFITDLEFAVSIMTLDDGIYVSWSYLRTTVEYEGKKETIELAPFDRTWKIKLEK